MRNSLRLPTFLASLFLALGLVGAAAILARSWVRVRTVDEQIRVFGSARRSITSDFIIWRGTFSRSLPTSQAAYGALKADEAKIRAYLQRAGVPDKEIFPSAIESETIYLKTPPVKGVPADYNPENLTFARKISGYKLSEDIEVRSSKVGLVDDLSRRSTELLSQGLDFKSSAPMYLYTKMSEIKVTMQAEAAADARARAEQIAVNSGCRLGAVRYARMSTPSITPAYATSDDDGGVDDTSSLDKRITAIVSVGYGIR